MSCSSFLPLDNHQRRIFRLAFGVIASSAIAIGVGWPLSYMVPMLVATILGGSDAPLGLKKSLAMLLIILIGLYSGVLFGSLFMGQPVLASLLLSVIFFWIYYFNHRGLLPNFASLMLIVGMTAMPLLAQIDPKLGSLFSHGFILAAFSALVFTGVSHLLFGHCSSADKASENKQNVGHDHGQSVRMAAISTLVVMPAMIYFLTFSLVSSALVIIFIAILSLNPELDQGKKAGIGLLLGNLIGGALAVVFYQLMKTSPHFDFYLALLALFVLFIVQRANSGKKVAPLWSMALTTFLVLTGPIFSGEGDDAGERFSTRLLQIACAAIYIILAFYFASKLWTKNSVEQSVPPATV